MDADLVQPEEGLAWLAEIEAWSQPADGEDTPEGGSIRHPSLVALDALAQTDWGDASAARAALDKASAVVSQSPGTLAASRVDTGNTGDTGDTGDTGAHPPETEESVTLWPFRLSRQSCGGR
jgi:hypothetical protein